MMNFAAHLGCMGSDKNKRQSQRSRTNTWRGEVGVIATLDRISPPFMTSQPIDSRYCGANKGTKEQSKKRMDFSHSTNREVLIIVPEIIFFFLKHKPSLKFLY